MGEIQKQTDEIRVETEDEVKALIKNFKEEARENGYEITSYSVAHKVKKDDVYYIVKIVKVW